jgi:hypothetical protein
VICFVSLEHEGWFEHLGNRDFHLTHCMGVKLKVEAITGQPCLVQRYTDVTHQRLQALGITALLIQVLTSWPLHNIAP